MKKTINKVKIIKILEFYKIILLRLNQKIEYNRY